MANGDGLQLHNRCGGEAEEGCFLTVAMIEVPSNSVAGSPGPEVSAALPITVPFSTQGET